MPTSPTGIWPACRRAGSRRGFTLAELLVVMSIIVIMSAVAAPSFINLLSTSRLRAGARGVLAQCRYARDLATRERTYARVMFDPEGGVSQVELLEKAEAAEPGSRGAVTPVGGSRGGVGLTGDEQWVAPGAALGAPRRLPDGIEFDRMASRDAEGATEITFAPDGRGVDFFLTLRDSRDQTLAVHVSATTGTVRIIAPEDDEAMEHLEREFGG